VKFIAGVVGGVLLVAGVGFFYFLSGKAPVAVSDQGMPFEKFLAKSALHARIEKEMPKDVPIALEEGAYMAGAKVYSSNCAVCHGFPNRDRGPIAKGMFPKPPHLFDGKAVTDDEPGETYWKVANGIRLTGMPAFKNSLSEAEMWQVSVLLANANRISAAVKDQLKPPNSDGPPTGVKEPGTPLAKPGHSKAPGSKPNL